MHEDNSSLGSSCRMNEKGTILERFPNENQRTKDGNESFWWETKRHKIDYRFSLCNKWGEVLNL